jgi:hypothetical protein
VPGSCRPSAVAELVSLALPLGTVVNTDRGIKRLRWVMLSVMTFDLVVTLAGQPASYWHKPTTANEGDPIVRLVMHQGVVPLLLVSVVYGVTILAIVSVLPRRPALVVLLLFTLWHYYGASTWLQFEFGYAYGGFLSGVVLAALLVAVGLDTRQAPARRDQHPQDTA